MSIDILAYELKYKNDQMVLDLLKAYQEFLEPNDCNVFMEEDEE